MKAQFGWLGVVRLGLVQAALGAIVVLTTSTLNRVMVVEMALPALLPGLLLAWHYVVQMARPRMGHGADQGRRCTPWILGGMVILALTSFIVKIAPASVGSPPRAPWASIVPAHSVRRSDQTIASPPCPSQRPRPRPSRSSSRSAPSSRRASRCAAPRTWC